MSGMFTSTLKIEDARETLRARDRLAAEESRGDAIRDSEKDGYPGTVGRVSNEPRGPGRPRRTEEASTARLEVKCTPEEKAAWVDKATAENKSISDVVRELLASWMRAKPAAQRRP